MPAEEIEEARATLAERWAETVNVMHAAWLDGEPDPRAPRLRARRGDPHAAGRVREARPVSFDFEGVFNEDYLHFYEQILTPERTAEDVDKIVELLDRPPGAEILDCPCGHGRIANELAARGFRVAGLDASEFFLERARADAAAQGVAVEYTQGDMRSLPWRERFDALVNWFTSFGYFSDEQNKVVL